MRRQTSGFESSAADEDAMTSLSAVKSSESNGKRLNADKNIGLLVCSDGPSWCCNRSRSRRKKDAVRLDQVEQDDNKDSADGVK